MPRQILIRLALDERVPIAKVTATSALSGISWLQDWTMGHWIQALTIIFIILQIGLLVPKYLAYMRILRARRERIALGYPTIDRIHDGKKKTLWSRLRDYFSRGKHGEQ